MPFLLCKKFLHLWSGSFILSSCYIFNLFLFLLLAYIYSCTVQKNFEHPLLKHCHKGYEHLSYFFLGGLSRHQCPIISLSLSSQPSWKNSKMWFLLPYLPFAPECTKIWLPLHKTAWNKSLSPTSSLLLKPMNIFQVFLTCFSSI